MKPLIFKSRGRWCVTRIECDTTLFLKAVKWCHARNIAEGNYQ